MFLLLVVAVAGFAAQLVDGSLGMGYGVLSMSLLLAAGLTPAIASATVHVAKIGTALASGAAHWRFGNVDRTVLVLLAIPGAAGAYLGARVLTGLSVAEARPWVSVILLVLGGVIIARFIHGRRERTAPSMPPNRPRWMLIPLGLVGGFVDASGGGGWGPVTTSTLIASGRLAPRMTIGTVNAAELAVAVAASLGFLQALGSAGFRWDLVAAMLIGGVAAAPLAAWLVRHVNERALGIAVGVLILGLSADGALSLLRLREDLLMALRIGGLAVAGILLLIAVAARARSARRNGAMEGQAPAE